ncbi:thermonuclease family protein [Fictibacillus enclensis]|uniref:thermonuclease family protein n=1 Tax=Fictibacillus enclensis TaxID=1017270 RepID=UPI0025A1C2DC|nr:thermonuclease family protein [Fictibacillus enclensis]MDM5335845.1 thermonuclease family protein [Fictibacillus enclensis]
MLTFLEVTAFLLFIGFGIYAFINIFRKKKVKKNFIISALAFIVFIVAIVNDPTLETTSEADPVTVQKAPLHKEAATQGENKYQEKMDAKKEKAKKPSSTDKEKKTTDKTAKTPTKPTTPKKSTGPVVSHGTPAKVVRVIDGDTIEVLLNGKQEEIRMLLIDTPETKHPQKPVEKFGPEASQFATKTLKNKKVGIQVGKERTDKYGRILAYVWVGNKTYQEMVLEKGLAATAYLYNDLTMLDTFHKAQDKARNAKIGVWSIPGYAHVDHDHGFHYKEEKKAVAKPKPKPVAPKPAPAAKAQPKPAPATKTEFFQNCTELRTKYPNGVPAGHPAYQSKMDRDKDNYACER